MHAHWLPSALAALKTGKPFVVQLWGTDVELARKAPWLFRPILRRARLAIVASEFLAAAARELGAREVRVVPSPVELPESVGEPDEPPHVLFVGRLSPEKGIHEFLAATEGLPRVIVGAGPVDVPEAVGFVPRAQLGAYYERAAVVCVPSRREGYGVVAREAMAYGRPVVATAVGGLADAIEDGVTGLLVRRRRTGAESRDPACCSATRRCASASARPRREAVERPGVRGSRAPTRPRSGEAESLSARRSRRSSAAAARACAPAARTPPVPDRSAAAVRAAAGAGRALALARVRAQSARRQRSRAPARLPRSVRRGRPRARPPGDAEGARAAMLAWIERHPPRPGDAWHPYPLSTRAGNWLAALALEPEAATSAIVESLWSQLLYLRAQCRGRHPREPRDPQRAGAPARGGRLRVGGAARRRQRLLARELPEQVLSDGGHYERSPVYHLIVLRDLLEVEAAVPGSVPADVIERMQRFAAGLARPDGQPALFNDGTLDLAPQLELPPPQEGLSVFPRPATPSGAAAASGWRSTAGRPRRRTCRRTRTQTRSRSSSGSTARRSWSTRACRPTSRAPSATGSGARVRIPRSRSTGATSSSSGARSAPGRCRRSSLSDAAPGLFEARLETAAGVTHERSIAIGDGRIEVEDRVGGAGEIESALPLGDGSPGAIVPQGSLRLEREPRQIAERLFERREGAALVLRGRHGSSRDLRLGDRLGRLVDAAANERPEHADPVHARQLLALVT